MGEIKKFFMIVLILLFTACGEKKIESNYDKKIIIKDISGAEIRLEKTLEKVLIQGSGSGGPFMTMMALDRENFQNKIVAMDDGMNLHRNDLWKRLVDAEPKLKEIKKIGDASKNQISSEEVLAINPDGIIAPIMYKPVLDKIHEKTNIPVIYIDYHSQDLEKHIKSTEIIAEATGLVKNKEAVNNFYKKHVEKIIETASKIEEKPKVYIEMGFAGPKQYDLSYGKNKMWGRIAEDTGGRNIMRDVFSPEDAKPASPEYVLKENPDIIIITGSIWTEMPDSMKLGFDVKKDEVQKKLKEYTERDGWKNLNAVKNKEVYAVGHSMCRDMTDFYAYEVLAKIFHKEQFKNINPDKDIKEYYEKFMPIKFEGTWVVKYE